MLSIITGGSRGIGYAIAAALAEQGSDLLLVSRSQGNLEHAAGALRRSASVQVHTAVCDMASEDQIAAFANECIKAGRIPDLLVLNAGIFLEGALTQSDSASYRSTLQVNLDACYYLVRHLAPHMESRSSPRIVLIASTAAYEPYPLGPLYGVAKWALRGYAINLRKELAHKGIGVTLLSPGGTLTDLWAGEDLPPDRLLKPSDIGILVATLTKLSRQAVVEEIIVRPMLGDIHE